MAIEWFADRKILMIVNGPMSQEWFDIADDCRGNVTIFDIPYNEDPDINAFSVVLQKEKYDILMFTATDVFTGTRMPMQALSAAFREFSPEGSIVTDVSGSIFCGADAADAGYADICLCGSEIAMGIPPGLGMVVPNERAHTRLLAHNLMNGRYFNYPRKTVSRSASALDVPSYPLLNALNEQIDMILTEGMTARIQRLTAVWEWLRQWTGTRGLSIYAGENSRALNCTAIEMPEGLVIRELIDFAARYGIFVSGGIGMMPENTLVLYHGNDIRVEDVTALTKVLDRFLVDFDARRRRRMPQKQKV